MAPYRPLIRTLTCLSLALILALTSVHLAVMRGESGAVTTWLEICDDGGVTFLAVDGTGTPVRSHPTCPDCVIAAAVIPPATPQAHRPTTATLALATAVLTLPQPPIQWLDATARGPPVRA
jgi:hypothetical protein